MKAHDKSIKEWVVDMRNVWHKCACHYLCLFAICKDQKYYVPCKKGRQIIMNVNGAHFLRTDTDKARLNCRSQVLFLLFLNCTASQPALLCLGPLLGLRTARSITWQDQTREEVHKYLMRVYSSLLSATANRYWTAKLRPINWFCIFKPR